MGSYVEMERILISSRIILEQWYLPISSGRDLERREVFSAQVREPVQPVSVPRVLEELFVCLA